MYYPVLDYPCTWCTQYPVLDLCDPHIWYIHYPVLDTASGIPSILYWIYVIPISGIFSIFGNLLPSAGLMESALLIKMMLLLSPMVATFLSFHQDHCCKAV